MIYLALYAMFFRIGLFAVGGGLATLPFLYEMANKYDWLSLDALSRIQAVSQSAPGAIGVNMAAYTGYTCAGVGGAAVAAFGIISPSIIIIVVVARTLSAFKENRIVKAVFLGLRPAAAGLLAAAGAGIIKGFLYDASNASNAFGALRWRELLIFAAFYVLIVKLKLHPAVYILAAGILGLVLEL